MKTQAGENVDVREVKRTIECDETEKNRMESHLRWDCAAHVSTTVNIFTDL